MRHWWNRATRDVFKIGPAFLVLVGLAGCLGTGNSNLTPHAGQLSEQGYRDYREWSDKRYFKVFYHADDGAWAWRSRSTLNAALKEASSSCEGHVSSAFGCRLFAVGNTVVWGKSEGHIAKVLAAYRQKNKAPKVVTTRPPKRTEKKDVAAVKPSVTPRKVVPTGKPPAVTANPAAAPKLFSPRPKPVPTVAGLSQIRFHAIVIGNNNYRSLDNLKTAITDAQAVSRILREAYDFRVRLLTNATRREIMDTLDEYREGLSEHDFLLIYYAGHGWLDNGSNQGYWLPVDARRNRRSNWVSNTDVTDVLRAIQSRHVLIVADSCYSGTLARSPNRGLQAEPKTRSYLAKLLQIKSRTVLTSGSLEPVSDGGGGGHSVFARAFLDALGRNKTIIDATELSARVRQQVLINERQTPQYQNIRFVGHVIGGDFVFARK